MPDRAARLTLARLFALLLLLWLPQAEAAIPIKSARVWPAQDYTRLTLESASQINFNMFTLDHPDRVVIELTDVDVRGALDSLAGKIAADDPYIKSARAAQYKPGVVRLVLTLKAAAKPQLFSLKPVGEYGYRLVLDVYPSVAGDPLMALAMTQDRKLSLDGPDEAAASAPPAAATDRGGEVQAASEQPPSAEAATPAAGKRDKRGEPPAAKAPAASGGRTLIVVIDAGHGGEDSGARGHHGTLEKDVTLAIARRLKQLVDETGTMRGVLTRDGDYFIPLGERVVKGRKAHADLFVSVHADSFTRSTASGSSVFALSEHGATSAAARWLAKNENDADLIGGVNIAVKDPYLAKTLLDLSQTATIADSLKLGHHVLRELGSINTLHHRHVEQAGFAVLKAPDIPSILVETAFISNPKEERRLKEADYQDSLAHAILGGIKRYFAENPALSRSKVAQAE